MYTFLIIITAYNLFVGFRYIWTLEKELKKDRAIYGDSLHSLQHIAVVGILLMLAVAKLFGESNDHFTLVMYVFYNIALATIVLPHLMSEPIYSKKE